MTNLKYRATVAGIVLSGVTLAGAQGMHHNSFGSSMFAAALSKFHSVKNPARGEPVVSASAQQNVAQIKQVDVLPIKSAPSMSTKPTLKAAVQPALLRRSSPSKPDGELSPITQLAKPTPGKKPAAYTAGVPDEIVVVIHGPVASPEDLKLEPPIPAEPGITLTDSQPDSHNPKLKWFNEGYFDAGYEKILGTFTTQVLRYGVRYGQDDIHMYVRNETFDTNGTGLPYPQAITGLSAGLEARHWFPGDQLYAAISYGQGISGYESGKADARYGLAGYTNWSHNRWFSDVYGELFYIALATDTFFDMRLRSGQKWYQDKKGYLWGYVVGQFWVSGQVESPTENRAELGLGIGYVFEQAISVNFELRGGYAFRGPVDSAGDMTYFNPTFIIAGGWHH